MLSVTNKPFMASVVMLNVIYAECHKKTLYAEFRCDECHYAECRYAECRSAHLSPYRSKLECLFQTILL
jgi:hypothetical protein